MRAVAFVGGFVVGLFAARWAVGRAESTIQIIEAEAGFVVDAVSGADVATSAGVHDGEPEPNALDPSITKTWLKGEEQTPGPWPG